MLMSPKAVEGAKMAALICFFNRLVCVIKGFVTTELPGLEKTGAKNRSPRAKPRGSTEMSPRKNQGLNPTEPLGATGTTEIWEGLTSPTVLGSQPVVVVSWVIGIWAVGPAGITGVRVVRHPDILILAVESLKFVVANGLKQILDSISVLINSSVESDIYTQDLSLATSAARTGLAFLQHRACLPEWLEVTVKPPLCFSDVSGPRGGAVVFRPDQAKNLQTS
eukprot:TRINITY_DN3589_c0_g1_i1.p1 TRINITY_DN3589_c0_g1~~TRINITY_DN3589_c0_g1_i1.p1  ORF type:complete len:222 (+),score=5.46 TRINITY_DN3589_c0_g1_i1:608-1273(+)